MLPIEILSLWTLSWWYFRDSIAFTFKMERIKKFHRLHLHKYWNRRFFYFQNSSNVIVVERRLFWGTGIKGKLYSLGELLSEQFLSHTVPFPYSHLQGSPYRTYHRTRSVCVNAGNGADSWSIARGRALLLSYIWNPMAAFRTTPPTRKMLVPWRSPDRRWRKAMPILEYAWIRMQTGWGIVEGGRCRGNQNTAWLLNRNSLVALVRKIALRGAPTPREGTSFYRAVIVTDSATSEGVTVGDTCATRRAIGTSSDELERSLVAW